MAKVTNYESDTTRMIRELLKQKPHIEEERTKGRGLWWDKRLDLDLLRRVQAARVPAQGYAYQNNHLAKAQAED